MIVALVCTAQALDELRDTVLYRRNVDRRMAHNIAQARAQAAASPPDIIVVDHHLPDAPRLVSELREDPLTRRVSIAVLARGDFDTADVALLQAGANAILRLPPGPDWDDRLSRLIHIPVRREARLPIHLQIAATFGSWSETFPAMLVNLSIHGMLLLCGRLLQVGDDVHFAFQLSGRGGLINGTGTVIREVGADQYGVELTHVDGDGRRLIRQFVESEGSAS